VTAHTAVYKFWTLSGFGAALGMELLNNHCNSYGYRCKSRVLSLCPKLACLWPVRDILGGKCHGGRDFADRHSRVAARRKRHGKSRLYGRLTTLAFQARELPLGELVCAACESMGLLARVKKFASNWHGSHRKVPEQSFLLDGN